MKNQFFSTSTVSLRFLRSLSSTSSWPPTTSSRDRPWSSRGSSPTEPLVCPGDAFPIWGQCYNTLLSVIYGLASVCSWQAFPAWSNVCGWGQVPTLEWSTWKVIHSGRLFTKILNLRTKKFYNIGPWTAPPCAGPLLPPDSAEQLTFLAEQIQPRESEKLI